MKKFILLIIIGSLSLSLHAQITTNALPGWCIDVNLLGGNLQQKITNINFASAYAASLNGNISDVKGRGYRTLGGDIQIGHFWGARHHFGVGTGIMFLQQNSNATVDQFHIEYRSLDYNRDTFRQLLTANGPVKETVTATNINIPLMLKYQTQFSKRLGLMVDAGALINIGIVNKYSTNASFDYEAIYKFAKTNDEYKPVYDYAQAPESNDWKITQAQYKSTNSDGMVADYFNSLKGKGYNVGLGVKPDHTSGSVSYKTGSIGFLIQPALSYRISTNVFLKAGVYYMVQSFTGDPSASYRMTDKSGEYNSMLKGVTKSEQTSYGANLGVRFFFGKINSKDRDGDGIPDIDDKCPDVFGVAKCHGCPDADGDGIADAEDQCPHQFGQASAHGCPDKDGDGVRDSEDDCPDVPGLVRFRGCPDKDGDGVPDKDDDCPDVAGSPLAHGCPDKDGDGVADKFDNCPDVAGSKDNRGCPYDTLMTRLPDGNYLASHILLKKTIINFAFGESDIDSSAYPVLAEAIAALNSAPKVVIFICGYTDDIGSNIGNLLLSVSRAQTVNKYLLSKGIPKERIIIAGYGKQDPLVDNNSAENRARNRRIELRLLLPL